MKLYNVTISGNSLEEFLADLENARAWVHAQMNEIENMGGEIGEHIAQTTDNPTNANITNLATALRAGNAWAAENGGQNDEPPLEYLMQEQTIADILDNDGNENIDEEEAINELEQLYNRYF